MHRRRQPCPSSREGVLSRAQGSLEHRRSASRDEDVDGDSSRIGVCRRLPDERHTERRRRAKAHLNETRNDDNANELVYTTGIW